MLKLSHLVVKWNYADWCNLIENRNAIWSELITQYCRLRRKVFGFRAEGFVYFTIGLFILAGRPSAALEVNGKGKGRILNEGKENVAEGKGRITLPLLKCIVTINFVKKISSLIGFSSSGRCFLVTNIFLYFIIGREIKYIMIKINNIKDIDILVLLILMKLSKCIIQSEF